MVTVHQFTTKSGKPFTHTQNVTPDLRQFGYFPVIEREVTDREGNSFRIATVMGIDEATVHIIFEGM